MKLSKNAKEVIEKRIVNAFGDEIRAKQQKIKDMIGTANNIWNSVSDEIKKFQEHLAEETDAFFRKKLKLHYVKLASPGPNDRLDIHIMLPYRRNEYHFTGAVGNESFEETATDTEGIKAAENELNQLKKRIAEVVKQALFEIEMHGKKDTVDEIVESVINKAKENK